MKYANAEHILPEAVLEELRKYIPEGVLYIPCASEGKRQWGEKTGTRRVLQARNEDIRRCFRQKVSIEALSEAYCLSVETIKKIVYSR